MAMILVGPEATGGMCGWAALDCHAPRREFALDMGEASNREGLPIVS